MTKKKLIAKRIALVLTYIFAVAGWSGSKLQAQEFLYEFGAKGGLTHYAGDIGRRGPFVSPSAGIGAEMRYNINFRFALSAELSLYNLKGQFKNADNIFPEGKQGNFSNAFYFLGVMGEYNFLPLSDKYKYLQTSPWSPYLAIGLGAGATKTYKGTRVAPVWQIGGGIKYKLSEKWTLQASWIYHGVASDALDAPDEEHRWLDNPYNISQSSISKGDGFGALTFGFTYSFGNRYSDCTKVKKAPKFKPLKFK